MDDLARDANQTMLRWLAHYVPRHGALTAEQLSRVTAAKNDALATWREMCADSDPEADRTWFGRFFRSRANEIVGVREDG